MNEGRPGGRSALHHVVRILFVLMVAPLAFRLVASRLGNRGNR